MWKKLWEKFKTPSKALLAVTYVVTVVCIAWAMVMLVISPGKPVLEIISYVAYACACLYYSSFSPISQPLFINFSKKE